LDGGVGRGGCVCCVCVYATGFLSGLDAVAWRSFGAALEVEAERTLVVGRLHGEVLWVLFGGRWC
jgi:hypothetical protein